jgi:hypothetical protein
VANQPLPLALERSEKLLNFDLVKGIESREWGYVLNDEQRKLLVTNIDG